MSNCEGVAVLEGPQSISEVHLNVKNASYISKRGWTRDIMDDAIHNGIRGTTTNLATSNMSYVYMASNGSYMVIDSVSYELVQLSKFGDMGWIPNPPIVWRK